MSIVFNPLSGQFDFVGAGSGGGPATATKYTRAFNNTTDWTLSSPDYFITTLAATHGKGTVPSVMVFELVGSDYELVVANILISASGDVTVKVAASPDNRFNGLILII